jgi:hypothetical protein
MHEVLGRDVVRSPSASGILRENTLKVSFSPTVGEDVEIELGWSSG